MRRALHFLGVLPTPASADLTLRRAERRYETH